MHSGKNKRGRLFYGYIVVAGAFLIQAVTFGTINSFGIFFVPLSAEFGWTRAVTSGPRSLSAFLTGLVSIVAGRLNDKFNPRLVITSFLVLVGLGYLLMSQVNAIWQFYLFYGVIVGIGMSGADVPVLSVVARWFTKKRGMMTGITKVGAGLGMLIIPLVINWIILDYGWRTSYVVIGFISLIFLITAAQFFRRDPGQMGLLPDGDTVMEDSPASEAKGFSIQQAIHTRQFRLIAGMFFLYDLCVYSIMTHIYPHAVDLGISETVSAYLLSTIGGASIIGRFVMGSAGDRIGNKLAIIIDLTILSAALLWLQFANEVWMLYLFVALYGFAHGGLFTLISPMTAQLFGLGSHGVIFGTIYFFGTVGGSIGPVLVGYIFDVTGSYQLGFILLVAASIIATLLMVNIKTE